MSTIKLEKTYHAPKEAVWEYLINDELLSSWCMPCEGFELEADKSLNSTYLKIYFSAVDLIIPWWNLTMT